MKNSNKKNREKIHSEKEENSENSVDEMKFRAKASLYLSSSSFTSRIILLFITDTWVKCLIKNESPPSRKQPFAALKYYEYFMITQLNLLEDNILENETLEFSKFVQLQRMRNIWNIQKSFQIRFKNPSSNAFRVFLLVYFTHTLYVFFYSKIQD